MRIWRCFITPEDKNLGCVWDMHEAACQIRDFSQGKSFGDYQQNRMLRLAVERLLEIMGQAAREVSQDFIQRHSDVPWAKIVRLRNLLAHEYGEVKHEKVFLVATRDIFPLIDRLQRILQENNVLK